MAQIEQNEVDKDESGDGDSGAGKSGDKTIILSENYRLKYDSTKNKWIEKRSINDNKESKNYGKETWTKYAGYMPTFEWLLWDFAIKHTANAECKSAHELIKKIAESEKLVSDFAKTIGKELDKQHAKHK